MAYKGAAPVRQAVLAQEVNMTLTPPASMRGFIERGQLQAIAYKGAKRASALPNVPTMTEQGFADTVLTACWGVFLPAGVPAPVLRQTGQVERPALLNLPHAVLRDQVR